MSDTPHFVCHTDTYTHIDAKTGKRMKKACDSSKQGHKEISLNRTWQDGSFTVSCICNCKQDVSLSISENEDGTYLIQGEEILQGVGDICSDHRDCNIGLLCNDGDRCEALTGGNCILSRGDGDCEAMNDSIKTKCYITEAPPGQGICGCDNDPSSNPCPERYETCDFLCQVGDDIPSCDSPSNRNEECEAITAGSVCPSGGGDCVVSGPLI